MRKKRIKLRGITISDIKYYKATVIKRVWYWHKNRHIEQWHRIGSPEVKLNLYGQIIFNKTSTTIRWIKNRFFRRTKMAA